MKEILLSVLWISVLLITGTIQTNAQDNSSKVHVTVTRNGEIIKDTSYIAEKDENIEMALSLLDLALGDTTSLPETKIYAYHSDDGKKERQKIEMYELKDNSFSFEQKDGKLDVQPGKEKEKAVRKKIIIGKTGDTTENEIIIRELNEDPSVEEIIRVDDGKHRIMIINDNNGKEKVIKMIKDKENPGSYKFETTEEGTIIIHTGGGNKKEIEVQVEEKNNEKKENHGWFKRNRK